jgi:signal-transduction protein with cAMP-binding, CBS, and nucleotidyltransferase domain
MHDKNTTIDKIMTRSVTTLPDSAPLVQAAQAMRDQDIGGIIVTKSDGTMCGFVTDRDLVVRGLASGRDPSNTKLADICTKNVTTLRPSQTIADAIGTMSARAVRRVPVVENGKAVGMVSLGDLAGARDPESVLGRISAAPPQH